MAAMSAVGAAIAREPEEWLDSDESAAEERAKSTKQGSDGAQNSMCETC